MLIRRERRSPGGHIKRYPSPEVAQLAASKASALSEIAARAGFTAPRVLTVDGSAVVYEQLSLGVGFDAAMVAEYRRRSLGGVADLCAMAGKVLAHIHVGLTSSDDWAAVGGTLSSQGSSEAMVGLHGDYSFVNLFVSSNVLTVLDPEPRSIGDLSIGHFGPPEYDIGMFYSCLCGRVTGRRRTLQLYRDRRRNLAHFLAGYSEVANYNLDAALVADTARALLMARLPYHPRQVRPLLWWIASGAGKRLADVL